MESNAISLMITTNQRIVPAGGRTRIENPFTLKVGQVITGFGVGCGLGVGVGRPLNLGAIPMLGQVMSATRGATDAFSGVGRHVNDSLSKYWSENIEAGIGCGIGFGFEVGLAVMPSVLHQVQTSLVGPLLNEEKVEVNQMVGKLQSENNMLQMVLKHQQLMEENEKLRQVLVEDLKYHPAKLREVIQVQRKVHIVICFEYRRKQRRK